MKFYHVYTKGLKDDLIFRDREDFITGMNYVPVSIQLSGAAVVAFVLMSNHLHFILYSSRKNAEMFIDTYKRIISRYISNKYGVRKLLRSVPTTCSEIDLRDDSLKRIIAYVLNNPVNAGINCIAQNYEWGSGRCYFTNCVDRLSKPLCEYTVRERCSLLKSQVELSGHFRFNSHGYIEPGQYVMSDMVEKLYRNPKSMEYFLSTSHKAGVDISKDGPMTFSDNLVLAGLNELLDKRYSGVSISDLSLTLRIRIILELRKQFNCTKKQLSRVTGISLRDIVNMLE